MEQVLIGWGFPELSTNFKKNDILDLDVLSDLLFNHPDDAVNVISSAGVRMKLKKLLKEHLESNKNISIELKEIDKDQLLVTNSVYVEKIEAQSEQKEPDNLVSFPTEPIDFGNTEDSDFDEDELNKEQDPLTKKRKLNIHEFDLCATLEADAVGRALLLRRNIELDTIAQSYLCDIITRHFLNINQKLDKDDYLILREKVIELFPLECPQTYFVPPVTKKESRKNKSEKSAGKLVDKYRNKRTFILNSEKLARTFNKQSVSLPTNQEVLLDVERSKSWLIVNRDGTEETLKHWDATYELRQIDAKNQAYKVLGDIYKSWPVLEDSNSYKLIERDFLKISPESCDNFLLKWNSIFDVVFKLFQANLKKEHNAYIELLEDIYEDELQADCKIFIQLILLTTALSPKSNKISIKQPGKKSKTFWKPTKIEGTEGVAIHVKIPGDIEDEVSKKRTKMRNMGLPLQPFIIIVGPTYSQIEKCYIRVDSVMYELSSLSRALDVLFKIFMTFNVSYAPESENFCYFIQWAVYNFYTKSDTQIPSVLTILNKVKRRLNQLLLK